MPATSHTPAPLILTGTSLSIEALSAAARDCGAMPSDRPRVCVSIDPAALVRVAHCRQLIDRAVRDYTAAYPGVNQDALMYGVTSGFGEFKSVAIPPADLVTLQQNILLSHASGVGDSPDWLDPANYFPAEVVRAALIVRLNAFLRGHSGIRPELCRVILAIINAGIVPLVPTKGSVGSSGDLCPLAHLFVTLLGRGYFYLASLESNAQSIPAPSMTSTPRIPWMIAGTSTTLYPAAELWDHLSGSASLDPDTRAAIDIVRCVPISHKEGLCLTNGATFSAAMLALNVHDAENLASVADTTVALSMESQCARVRFLDEAVHAARGMAGQIESAANIRACLHGTRLCEWVETTQDSYSLRCAPQVHGASRDAIAYAKMVALAEINAATDNPLFFPNPQDAPSAAPARQPFGVHLRLSRDAQKHRVGDTHAYSAGNFHGQPIGIAADLLTIAVAELANIAERRVQMLLDSHYNRFLPPNLTAMPGVDSGLMIAQYTAASLVSENKVLAHPASVDSIPTSANIEDHVAMATHAARKLRQVIQNASAVFAIELVVAAQAVDWRTCLLDDAAAAQDTDNYFAIDPNRPSPSEPRPGADPAAVQARARHRAAAFTRHAPAGPSTRTLRSLGVGSRAAYSALRGRVDAMHRDTLLEPMIRAARLLIHGGTITRAVSDALASAALPPLAPILPLRR